MQQYLAHNSLLPFYIAWQINPQDSHYNINFSYELSDAQKIHHLIEKLQTLIRLRPYLRQTFSLENNQLIANIHENLPADVSFYTSSTIAFETLEQTLINEAHDLQTRSLLKLNIINFTDRQKFVALFNIHHIIMDGPSLNQFTLDLNNLIAGITIEAETADEYISKVTREPLLKEYDTDSIVVNYIKEINQAASSLSYPSGDAKTICYHTDTLPDLITEKLAALSQQHQLSSFNLLLIAWGTFTAKLFNTNSALVKYPVNIRRDKSLNGCFLNTAVFSLHLTPKDSYLSLIQDWPTQKNILKQATKTLLSDKLEIGLIPCLTDASVANDQLIIENQKYPPKNFAQIAHSNLNIRYRQQAGQYHFTCDTYADLFPPQLAASLLKRFFNYLNKLFDNPTQQLSTFNILFAEEQRQILYDFNNTAANYPQNKTLVNLFEEQAAKTPHTFAIVYEKKSLTYAQLNERSNQLAHYLKNHYQIKPDDCIALLLDRDENVVIALLAVLKAGGTYVPIDPALPQERIHFILKDIRAKAVIIHENNRSKLNQLVYSFFPQREFSLENRRVIAIDDPEIRIELGKQIKTNPPNLSRSNNLAYIIYTSGTTGQPKGVLIEHQSVINTLFAVQSTYKPPDNSSTACVKIMAFANYAFDWSVLEFFIALLFGHEIHLLTNECRKDTALMSKYINSHQINYAQLPPVLLINLPKIDYPSLQGIATGSEYGDAKTALYWSNKCALYNYYGPTETSIYATRKLIKKDEINLIGKPLANFTAYVLDINKNLLPIGMTGELYLGGIGLSRGYLNQAELTAEKFIPNPFQSSLDKKNAKNHYLYKTGDLVRWIADGNLEYIGRNDLQVKIRGYRIELGEIENKLSTHPEIEQTIASVHTRSINERKDKFLVAHYLSKEKVDERNLYDFCAKKLPEYMIPRAFVHIEKVPLTANGKIDRSALPPAEFINFNTYIAPENEKEKLICFEFSAVLGLDRVGAMDDFFKLGGNSIKAIALIAQLQINFNVSISIGDLYNFKTPRKLTKKIFFNKNNIKHYLEKIKKSYQIKQEHNKKQQSNEPSLLNVEPLVCTLKKPISVILLTGATGFLGSNLLNELLTSTNYEIILLIRAKTTEEAYNRINNKFKYYFNKALDLVHKKRVFVLAGDLEKNNLSLSQSAYNQLVEKVDSIIHSAALTSHYGEANAFYSANVQTTINLLELCKLTQLKDFHYISTASVLDGVTSNSTPRIFTEDDPLDASSIQKNIYVKTKHQGEEAAIHYRNHGVTSNIYRVGNLAFIASNSLAQENIEDNGFFNRIKCLLKLGIIAKEISTEEISPADLTAQAIVTLFNRSSLSNKIYHVFNPHLFDLTNFFFNSTDFNVKKTSIEYFIDTLLYRMRDPDQQNLVHRFLVHQGWLNSECIQRISSHISQAKTHFILQKLGFTWTPIKHQTFSRYLKIETQHAEQIKNPRLSRTYRPYTSHPHLLGG